jgi:serine phosphatase RsbU (regulator of sigma subunit)
MQTVNDVLWSCAPGTEPGSMFVASLDTRTGQLDFSVAGETDAYILRPHGWEPIVDNGAPLGHDADWFGAVEQQTIHPGDVLLIFSHRHLWASEDGKSCNATSLAEALLRYVHLSAQDLADKASRLIAAQGAGAAARSVLVVKRHEAVARR